MIPHKKLYISVYIKWDFMWSQTHAELYNKLEINTLINLKKSFISSNLKN